MAEEAPSQPAAANQDSTQDLAEMEKEATELASSLSLGLLAEAGIGIPRGIDNLNVVLEKLGPNSGPRDLYDPDHTDRIKISISDANRGDLPKPTFMVDAHGPNIGNATGPLKGDGKFNNHMPYTAEEIRNTMQKFKDLPGAAELGVSFKLPIALDISGPGRPSAIPYGRANEQLPQTPVIEPQSPLPPAAI